MSVSVLVDVLEGLMGTSVGGGCVVPLTSR